MLKHYVEFLFPGFFLNEHEVKEVAERNPELIVVPEEAFAYRFFDQEETIGDGEKLVEERKNVSPLTYFGKVYTLEEVKAQFWKYDPLIFNMECHGYNKVVKTRCDTWHPLAEGDIVI